MRWKALHGKSIANILVPRFFSQGHCASGMCRLHVPSLFAPVGLKGGQKENTIIWGSLNNRHQCEAPNWWTCPGDAPQQPPQTLRSAQGQRPHSAFSWLWRVGQDQRVLHMEIVDVHRSTSKKFAVCLFAPWHVLLGSWQSSKVPQGEANLLVQTTCPPSLKRGVSKQ